MSEASVCECGKPTRDHAYICEGCLNDFRAALAETPWMLRELETTITRQRGIDYSAMSSGGPMTKEAGEKWKGDKPDLGVVVQNGPNAHATGKRDALRAALHTAVRFCHEEGVRHQSPKQGLPTNEPAAMSRWLMWRIDGLAFVDMGYQFADDVVQAHRDCHSAIDRKPERQYAGPCECGADLYCKPGETHAKCKGCERSYEAEALRVWMRSQVMGRLVTVKEGAALLGRMDLAVPLRTLKFWTEKGWVPSHSSNPKGHALYLFDDMIRKAAERVS